MSFGRWRLLTIAGAAIALLSGTGRQLAAQGTVTGRVTATGTDQPLADARVLVIGTSLSATTSDDGKYTIRNAPNGALQLQVLRVGYQSTKKPVTVVAGQSATADFSLTVAIAQLEEVVTTATGQARKVELGNALVDLGRRRQEGRGVGDLDHRRPAHRQSAGRHRAPGLDARRRADRARARRLVDQLEQRPDLGRGRRPHLDRRRSTRAPTRSSRCSTPSTPTRSRTSRS